jgi:chemotaxis protein CheD
MGGSPTVNGLGFKSLFQQRVIIEVGDMAVSNNTQVILSTYALGSCVGVVAYDPVAVVGGILHLMLPDSSISPDKAASQPAMFADTGLPRFFKAILGMRGEMGRLRVFVAGGASVVSGLDAFKIGERNVKVTLEYLERLGCRPCRVDAGGSQNRTVHLEIVTGTVTLKTPEATSRLDLAA